MKIIDRIREAESRQKPFYSYEYFPPKTPAGVTNLLDRVERMGNTCPLFVDVTWGAGGSTADLSLELAIAFQKQSCLETQMHLTCTNMEKERVATALTKCREAGIQNIIALRGDPPVGQERWEAVEGGFAHAVDLVKYIKEQHGDYFGIAVAGYPEGHTECESYEKDLQYLKDKVDAGADLILTQLFYDVDQFLKWMADCRRIGIKCPIIPGIMPVNGYASWKRMTDICKTAIPPAFRAEIEAVKDDDSAVKELGNRFLIDMCHKLLAAGVQGLHMYTLNLEKSVFDILTGLGMLETSVERRELPWRPRLGSKEEVRPIFWANRPKSYIHRTQEWDDYPNGRWGDSRSPAFGELLDYHLFAHTPEVAVRRKLWGIPTTVKEVGEVFASFVSGTINQLPWCQQLASETTVICDRLVSINRKGFWTINSQPRVNGVSSTHPQLGWGGPGGVVYGKAYLEFFCDAAGLEHIVSACQKLPHITYAAVNAKGEQSTNNKGSGVTAVTWGVFPDKEIVQPTVVDMDSFLVWGEEAFMLWKSWRTCYEGDEPHPESAALIQKIHDEFWLVNIVDNNFIEGDIFAVFD